MSIIRVQDVVKDFYTPMRYVGTFGSLRTLFTRKYTVKHAVNGISFSVDEGELVGYIGANGAGKSTTIKMLTGILVPTAGEIEVAGYIPWKDRERNALNIGVVFGQRSQLWWDLPLAESFKLVAKMYRVPRERYRYNIARFTEILGLEELMNTPVRQLSLGQRMRGDLVAALLHEPRIVYLDEPTIGLDVMAKERIRTFLEEINSLGTTVLLTTHDLSDIERLCHRIIVIDRGQVLYDGSVAQLKSKYSLHRVLAVQLAIDGVNSLKESIIEVSRTELIRREGAKVWLRFDPQRVSAASIIGEIATHYPIIDLSITEPELEQVIRKMYEE